MFKQLLLIFLGGGLGSVLRYLISKSLNFETEFIPIGTFTVNILGSLLLGLILGIAARSEIFNSNTVLFLAVGFCGGFTTFSSFAFENQALLRTGDYLNFFFYTFGSIILGILAVFLGLFLSKLT
ncbi:fluoride efflux transporter CrcB [Salegentibacter salegens]|jgi:CrcB protein|uniref:Fluoride-specific ion channel FluC n=1 Tax=Salegentibacter salegens TaxID=143223 RepID=A0A1M7NQZ0_9FLAO|nr:fluoride efflux transporter CrcB [Salegentibacter salegens]PRX41070.1 CrcB protein [Salegentibacter salegens]SHN06376.1 camphor resistance protein CrcB [Salegentibacter salegens]